MYIKSYSFDGENEASVVVTDGKFELICYAYPFNKKIKKFWLSTFLAKNIMIAYEPKYEVIKLAGFYSYKLQGKIIDIEKQIVTVGDIPMEIDGYIPKDIVNGDYVEFECVLIDLMQEE